MPTGASTRGGSEPGYGLDGNVLAFWFVIDCLCLPVRCLAAHRLWPYVIWVRNPDPEFGTEEARRRARRTSTGRAVGVVHCPRHVAARGCAAPGADAVCAGLPSTHVSREFVVLKVEPMHS